jgi:hypothetical protein
MQNIGVMGIGVYRHVAATMETTFQQTPYRMVAILDLTSEPESFRYSPHNLGVVLHTLIPRPQVLVTGAAISGEMTRESIRVWEAYVKQLGVKDTLLINVCRWTVSQEDCLWVFADVVFSVEGRAAA